MVKQYNKGFTLLEIMIAVAIIAILVAIAYPSYQQYILKTYRTDTRAEMLQTASRLQRYKIANFTFLKNGNPSTPVSLADIGVGSVLPIQGAPLYDVTLTDVTAGTWTLTATPKTTARMKGNGIIVLNSQGQRCWIQGQATCPLTDTSSWDE